MEFIQTLIDQANNILWGYVMIIALLGCAVYFTLRSRFVQFSMIGEMCRQLVNSTERHLDNGRKHISPFQAFVVSLASRVGTGNLAGVATAIAVGGAGALLSKAIKTSEVIAYDDLGTEAIRKLEVENFPVIVVVDKDGNNLYETAILEYKCDE